MYSFLAIVYGLLGEIWSNQDQLGCSLFGLRVREGEREGKRDWGLGAVATPDFFVHVQYLVPSSVYTILLNLNS